MMEKERTGYEYSRVVESYHILAEEFTVRKVLGLGYLGECVVLLSDLQTHGMERER